MARSCRGCAKDKISISTQGGDAPLSLAAAKELHRVVKTQVRYDGVHARLPRGVWHNQAGIVSFAFGSDTIQGTTYQEWDMAGSQHDADGVYSSLSIKF
jgi:hypothetical protein